MSALLESATHRVQLGIRLWDPLQDRQISDGLRAFVRPANSLRPRRWAFRTLSGNYAFRDLPGLRDLEYFDSEAPRSSPPAARTFWVEIADPERRYLPVGFELDLPRTGDALFTGTTSSPPEAGPFGIYLFSASTRLLGAGVAEIRGELERDDDGAPAAHALVEVNVGGGGAIYGMTDARGGFLVPLLYPVFDPGVIGSPPYASPPTSPLDQRWPMRLRVRYQPSIQRVSPDTRVPDLRAVLAQQPAELWLDPPNTISLPAPELVTELQFRRELVVRTSGRSTLIVHAASSPP